MAWDEDHRRKVATFPEDVRDAHSHCSNHRIEVEASEMCGCFYCCSMFNPKEIKEWVDENAQGVGQTAMCPRCGIDSVIGSSAGFPIQPEFLATMKSFWF
jgi:hypothetical protein